MERNKQTRGTYKLSSAELRYEREQASRRHSQPLKHNIKDKSRYGRK
jgi:hypothetical protein